MKILILEEKHGTRYIDFQNDIERTAANIVEERIKFHWYTEDEKKEAKKAIKSNNAWTFLRLRNEYEYERCEIVTLVQLF